MNEFGVLLRRLRRAQHLGVAELAAAVGMHAASLSNLENGRRNPSPELVTALLVVLVPDVRERALLMSWAQVVPSPLPFAIWLLMTWLTDTHRGVEQREGAEARLIALVEEVTGAVATVQR